MDMIPRNDYGERCQFDAYCKLVLYHEAIDYLREMQRHRDRELSFSDLPQMEMDKPDLRNVRPPEEPAKSEPATLDLESLVEQLQKSPELASALAALIAAQAPAK